MKKDVICAGLHRTRIQLNMASFQELYGVRDDEEQLITALKASGLLAREVRCRTSPYHEGVVKDMTWSPRPSNERIAW